MSDARKLREVIYQRFDFTEMARRSLGPECALRGEMSFEVGGGLAALTFLL
jgi:hypothetical protein